MTTLDQQAELLLACRQCPRLVAWREQVAEEKRAAFRHESYWGRPVPGFGDPSARLLVVGLAPAAHGANRTGRIFTGDRSGDWLFRAMHEAGFANQPDSVARHDGLELVSAYVTAFVKCAPPANQPSTDERDACRAWLEAELDLLTNVDVVVALGGLAYRQTLRILGDRGAKVPRPRPSFTHGIEVDLGAQHPRVLASYHPSQQNTFTGRLTADMLSSVFRRAASLVMAGQ